MYRSAVEARLREDHERDGYLYPAYGDYCFANVPDTVRSLFDAGGRRPLPADVFEGVDTDVERVVLVLVDGYGLDSFHRDHPEYDLLGALAERATVTPLTSTYPSETAAAITTLESGQYPCEHGQVGWNAYDPDTDRSFVALTGRIKAGSEDGADHVTPTNGDEQVAVAPEAFEEVDSLAAGMAQAGVDYHRLQPFGEGGERLNHHTYDGLDGFGDRLAGVTEAVDPPGYVYGYLPQIDAVSHEHGTDSEQFQATLATVCSQLRTFLDGLDPAVARETLLVVTADHGHVDTVPEENIDLSENRALVETLQRYGDGTPVTLSGSPRNVHLHVRDVPAAREALADRDATVFTREEVLESELFGDRDPSPTFRRRCGDLVVVHRDRGLWFGDVEPHALEHVGMHGGLHPEEMLVPFAAARADRV